MFYFRTNKLPDMMQQPSWPLDDGKKAKLYASLLVLAITIWGCVLVFPNMGYLSDDGRGHNFTEAALDEHGEPPDVCQGSFFMALMIPTFINLATGPMNLLPFVALCGDPKKEIAVESTPLAKP